MNIWSDVLHLKLNTISFDDTRNQGSLLGSAQWDEVGSFLIYINIKKLFVQALVITQIWFYNTQTVEKIRQ